MQSRIKTIFLYCITLAPLWAGLSSAYGADYPAPEVVDPSTSYTFPSGFSAFSPPVSGSAVSEAPEIAEWTRSNKPGKTLAITGEKLSAGDDTQFSVFAQGAAVQSCTIRELNGRMASVKLPSGLPAGSMYLMWPRNSKGYGPAVAINRAEAWWVGPKKAEKGSEFSVYGRNLELGSGASHLYIEELDQWLGSVSANPYKADFKLPSDVGSGTYTIWAHNGHGREYGWSLPLKLEVVSRKTWSGPRVNVKDHGAKGDGVANDYAAILSALSACPANGTVYFPAGRYAVGQSIRVSMTDKRFLGDGPETSVITTHSSYAAGSNYGMFHNDLKGMEFRDLGFSANQGQVSIVIRCRSAEDTRFINCRFDDLNGSLGSYTATVDMLNSENLTIEDCSIITYRGCNFGGADGLYFKNTDFRAWGDKAAGYLLVAGGADNMSMVNCTATHYDSSDYTDGWGWCQGRFVVLDGNGGANRNTYIGDCRTYDMAPRWNWERGRYEKDADGKSYQTHQNAGEQILAEHQRTMFRGGVDSATATTATCSGDISSLSGQILTVVSGRGFGQSRFVSSVDSASGRITVSEPWNVQPDSSSIISVGRYVSRMAVYGNHLDGPAHVARPFDVSAYHPPYDPTTSPVNTASCGINLFGGASECAIENNIFTEIEDAVNLWSLAQDKYTDVSTAQPNYFNIVANNSINGVVMVLENIADVSSYPFQGDAAIIGNVLRDNVYTNVAEALYSESSSDPELQIELMILEDNIEGAALPEAPDGPPPPDDPPPPVLLSISISGPAEVEEGATSDFTCIGTYSDATTAVVDAVWSVNNSHATVDSDGQLTAADVEQNRSVVLTAVVEQFTSVQTITIKYIPPFVSSLIISGPAAIDEESSAQYSCTAQYSDGSILSIDPAWSVSSSVASISSSGLMAAGNVTADQGVDVTASFGGKTETYSVAIRYVPPVLTDIMIIGAVSMDEGTSVQLNCIGLYSDGTSSIVYPAWSDNSSLVSISSGGLLSAGSVAADGSVTVSAAHDGFSDTHSVLIKYVPPYITGISILGPETVTEETAEQFLCLATYSDGSSQAIVPQWSEDSPYASIGATGLFSAGDVSSDQTLTVSALFDGKSDSVAVTVQYVAPVITAIEVTGPGIVDEENTALYTCTATYSDGTTAVIAPLWSENSSAAFMTTAGAMVTGNVTTDETVVITAVSGELSDSLSVIIKYVPPPVVLSGISISGAPSLNELQTASYSCLATYSDGSTASVTPAWSVDLPAASIGSDGTLSAGNVGADEVITVRAVFQGKTAQYTVSVAVVGTQIIYPLTGFEGQRIRAELYDQAADEWHDLGEMDGPSELVIENVNPDQWYWISVLQTNSASGTWDEVHSNWINM